MTRRMSCSMTIPAVRDRSKFVTRRHVDTWKNLQPGDRLTLIEKGMGLPKGAKQVVIADVEIVSVRVEELGCIIVEHQGPRAEGFPEMTPIEFIHFWLRGHGYPVHENDLYNRHRPCRRIEWRYLP